MSWQLQRRDKNMDHFWGQKYNFRTVLKSTNGKSLILPRLCFWWRCLWTKERLKALKIRRPPFFTSACAWKKIKLMFPSSHWLLARSLSFPRFENTVARYTNMERTFWRMFVTGLNDFFKNYILCYYVGFKCLQIIMTQNFTEYNYFCSTTS